jgi:hypothetical protein
VYQACALLLILSSIVSCLHAQQDWLFWSGCISLYRELLECNRKKLNMYFDLQLSAQYNSKPCQR